ncbi:NAD-dependent epimerase/dehydratase family protein [Luteimicrobium album]|uniref:NAD-dependent epimerase/dehydratase family protein n=1 Tax=Luteimicrobium album TaxID=1054550 RepID=UPI0024E13824|nr:NAD-dependent epimerase/dehydratase family protein [Luteimicrobium album]
MRVFVTGASGWIGSAVVEELRKAGHDVVVLARSESSAAAVERKGATALRGGLDDLDVLRRGRAPPTASSTWPTSTTGRTPPRATGPSGRRRDARRRARRYRTPAHRRERTVRPRGRPPGSRDRRLARIRAGVTSAGAARTSRWATSTEVSGASSPGSRRASTVRATGAS